MVFATVAWLMLHFPTMRVPISRVTKLIPDEHYGVRQSAAGPRKLPVHMFPSQRHLKRRRHGRPLQEQLERAASRTRGGALDPIVDGDDSASDSDSTYGSDVTSVSSGDDLGDTSTVTTVVRATHERASTSTVPATIPEEPAVQVHEVTQGTSAVTTHEADTKVGGGAKKKDTKKKDTQSTANGAGAGAGTMNASATPASSNSFSNAVLEAHRHKFFQTQQHLHVLRDPMLLGHASCVRVRAMLSLVCGLVVALGGWLRRTSGCVAFRSRVVVAVAALCCKQLLEEWQSLVVDFQSNPRKVGKGVGCLAS